ncbi:N-acetylglucosaminyl-phosphatidylinositol de-N-acetylase [Perkinsus olseni]|uniref:N-acetylglucosaminylphosphatidylinositol deacetylase n=1 Tax=Perkinsus olseni TaxID=32597 RepID=A0A7J6LPL4_PEROL|nr:N-acetylglucosaminyl-phosphatidylinositol de-N-acetylase [Perkinsus olseni]
MISLGSFGVISAIVLLLAFFSAVRLKFMSSPERFPFKSAVIVVAHPDDETMFFLPTIKWLKKLGIEINILCCTTGDYDGLGGTRKKEFEKVCNFLGARNFILDESRIRDGWEMWDADVTAEVLQKRYFERADMTDSAIITFDRRGISGHPNHRSVHAGVEAWRARFAKEKTVKVFNLQTVNILRKYLLPLDLLFMLMDSSRGLTIVNSEDPWALFRTMKIYHSQDVWFRKLFAVFSRYAYVNSLLEV